MPQLMDAKSQQDLALRGPRCECAFLHVAKSTGLESVLSVSVCMCHLAAVFALGMFDPNLSHVFKWCCSYYGCLARNLSHGLPFILYRVSSQDSTVSESRALVSLPVEFCELTL